MFLTHRFYIALVAVILTIAAGAAVPVLFTVGRGLLLLAVAMVLAEVAVLWGRRGIEGGRTVAERFSLGDPNTVSIVIRSSYPMGVTLEVIDEIPFVFQVRDFKLAARCAAGDAVTLSYCLTPTHRGVYDFGHVRVFASVLLHLVQRRFTMGEAQQVKVYPSYLMLRQYELLAHSRQLTEMGIKRIRRVGNNTDFEQIKDYVVGDDYRTINWRATARRHQLMVNQYQQERSQQVFCVIDKGRMMQQAFRVAAGGEGTQGNDDTERPRMTLFDYAINASLVLSYVAIHKEDRAGLVTFSDQMGTLVPASRQPGHMQVLREALYAEQTEFGETDFSALIAGLARHVQRRSLLVLFTSFTSMPALRRQLPFLRQLSLRHRLLVVFFQDEEVTARYGARGTADKKSTEECYQQVIAGKYRHEQYLVVATLRQYGIITLLTTPGELTVDVVNRYLQVREER